MNYNYKHPRTRLSKWAGIILFPELELDNVYIIVSFW